MKSEYRGGGYFPAPKNISIFVLKPSQQRLMMIFQRFISQHLSINFRPIPVVRLFVSSMHFLTCILESLHQVSILVVFRNFVLNLIRLLTYLFFSHFIQIASLSIIVLFLTNVIAVTCLSRTTLDIVFVSYTN
jgi:hypothetical protein